MTRECERIHELLGNRERHDFQFSASEIPLNGVYVLFEKGESGHGGDRIVGIGTHSGENQLHARLKEQFLTKNKDRSAFRKHIGCALLRQANDPFIDDWSRDLTSKKAKDEYSSQIDFDYQESIEFRVSQYIQGNFTFCVFPVNEKEEREKIKLKIIATVSLCNDCRPSEHWLGHFSPKTEIAASGLWVVQGLYKTPFDASELEDFSALLRG